MTRIAVAVLGPDRPGVVAALTGALLADEGNLEDASMTILQGEFAMTLVVSVPRTVAEVQADLAPVAAELDLLVSVREASASTAVGGSSYVVRVHGADRPGLVHQVTSLLAGHDVNITDLATRLIGGRGSETYVMHVACDLPEGTDLARVSAELARLAEELSVHATLRPAESDLL